MPMGDIEQVSGFFTPPLSKSLHSIKITEMQQFKKIHLGKDSTEYLQKVKFKRAGESANENQ